MPTNNNRQNYSAEKDVSEITLILARRKTRGRSGHSPRHGVDVDFATTSTNHRSRVAFATTKPQAVRVYLLRLSYSDRKGVGFSRRCSSLCRKLCPLLLMLLKAEYRAHYVRDEPRLMPATTVKECNLQKPEVLFPHKSRVHVSGMVCAVQAAGRMPTDRFWTCRNEIFPPMRQSS